MEQGIPAVECTRLRPIHRIIVSALLLFGLGDHAAAAPGIRIGDIVRLQPGWVRIYLQATDAPAGAKYQVFPVCARPVDSNSITMTVSIGANIAIDIKDNLAWIADNGMKAPCVITRIIANMTNYGLVVAEAIEMVNIPMDLPLSHLTPDNMPTQPTQTSIPLMPSTVYAAYPPLIIVVQTGTGCISFVELEELPDRKTVGLRGLATFTTKTATGTCKSGTSTLVFELGGGGEIQDKWGLDIIALGIWRSPQVPVEVSNPGHDTFTYTGTVLPPLVTGDPTLKIYPAPPLFTDTEYKANILDNRGVPLCVDSSGCMAFQYDLSNHKLNAVNGAKLALLIPAPIVVGTQTNPPVNLTVAVPARSVPAAQAGYGSAMCTSGLVRRNAYPTDLACVTPAVHDQTVAENMLAPSRTKPDGSCVPGYVWREANPSDHVCVSPATRSQAMVHSGAVIGAIDPTVAKTLLTTARDISAAPGRDIAALMAMPTALRSSVAQIRSNAITRDYGSVEVSPHEAEIAVLPGYKGGGPVSEIGQTVSQCVVNPANDGITQTPSACAGLHANTFACPTIADPIKVDELGPATDTVAALYNTISPYYAGRDNVYGTCGSHAFVQYQEALLNKYIDDLGVKRVIYVNGDPIVVPDPRIALSVSGSTAQWKTWDGTHSGDPPNNPGYSSSTTHQAMPQFPEAYWTARERNWKKWIGASEKYSGNPNLCSSCSGNPQKCSPANYWHSAFCMGQGHPGPGVYYSHSLQVQTLQDDPLSDPPWSLANHWFNIDSTPISVAKPDDAIQAVIVEITGGLPVLLSFSTYPNKRTKDGSKNPDGSDHTLTFSNGVTWYLPPELAGCTSKQLDGVLGRTHGHVVNIVGFWITGTSRAPDPVTSYFILENNWGKTAGYRSFFFMNFAAFRYLASGLTKYRLHRQCWSVACSERPFPKIPRETLVQLLYPPDPATSQMRSYQALVGRARAALSGVALP